MVIMTEDERSLFKAVKYKHLEGIKRLLKKDTYINVQDESRMTPLMLAVEFGYTEEVKLLIKRGADIEVQDFWKWTALHWAAYCGNTEAIKLLIKRGAKVNSKDNDGRTPLIIAVKSGNIIGLKLLIRNGANIKAKDNWGRCALDHAILGADQDIVKILKIKHKEVNNMQEIKRKRGRKKKTLVAQATVAEKAMHNNVAIGVNCAEGIGSGHAFSYTPVKIYRMKKKKIKTNSSAETIRDNSLEKMNRLLRNGIDPNINEWGNKALMYAASRGHTEAVELLIEKGVNIEAKDGSGWTALDYAAANGHKDIVEILERHKGITKKKTFFAWIKSKFKKGI